MKNILLFLMIVLTTGLTGCSNPAGSGSNDSSSEADASRTPNADGTYNIVFHGNDSTAVGSMTTLTSLPGESVTLPAGSFTSPAFAFNRWNTRADGCGTNYADQASFSMPSEHIDLYAVWPGVHSIAGSTVSDYADGSGSDARFGEIWSIQVGADGNLYLCDTTNYSIRICTPEGEVSTLAGSGSRGFRNGTGKSASFYYPRALCFDSNGDLIIADQNNHAIRKCTPAGVVTTYSTDVRTPSQVSSNGQGIFIRDTHNYRISSVNQDGSVTAFAGSSSDSNGMGYLDARGTNARLWNIEAMASDTRGNILVFDAFCLRKITPEGDVSTMAGRHSSGGTLDGTGGNARFGNTHAMCIDPNDNIYMSNVYSSVTSIRKITPVAVVETLVTGGNDINVKDGIFPDASIYSISAMECDSAGNIYFADCRGRMLRKWVF
jgi:hypothetical protein